MAVVDGWLLDSYPSRKGGMTFWIKTLNGGSAVRLKDSSWYAKIYASGEACEDSSYLFSKIKDCRLVRSIKPVRKRVDAFRKSSSSALEIGLAQAGKAKKVAELLENAFQNPNSLQLYNIDVLPEQQYYYEKDLFPLAHVRVSTEGFEIKSWEMRDSVESLEYETPNLRCMRLEIKITDQVPNLNSKLTSISITSFTDKEEDSATTVLLENREESQILRDMMREIDRFDPDLIITRNGDSFVLPYLRTKARKFSVSLGKLNRDAEESDEERSEIRSGKTYFSYGRILYRPVTQRLFGRLHLDEENTFVYDQCRLQGLFEVSRLCRMPIHTSMRASIGKCLSGLQFYHAFKQNLIIPWKPEITEDAKNGYELFVADRGGLVFNPLPGVHEHVCEIDFASLYPSIIRNYNISAETVNCKCCSDNSRYQIRELNMHVCDKRKGIVAESLDLPLQKRFAYKRMRDSTSDTRLKSIYNERAGALKWILVCCLARESSVLIKQNGIIQYVQIGNFIDSMVHEKEGIIDCPDNILVAGVDRNLKAKFCKIKKLLKIPNTQKLLGITLDDGRRVTATPNHPFYLLKNGRLEVRQASDLQEGNFIPVAKKLPSSSPCNDGFIDVTAQLTKNERIDRRDSACPHRITQTIERIAARSTSSPERTLGKSMASLDNVVRMSQGDLGFAKLRKIEQLDRIDDYVYCFELADNEEMPGFFAGEGAVFTHNCFGYLSYRNAKFGKIDSHIAVCALARQTLIDAMHTAEYRGFKVVHGIVDSLWLSKENAKMDDYRELCNEIEEATRFKLAIEGIYKWIVFLPSKTYSENQVANRYFGCFDNGTGKVRGIEQRRHDSPLYFKKCQSEILMELYRCNNENELRKMARVKGIEIFAKYAEALENHTVSPMDLLIRRRLSKDLKEYSSERQLSVSAVAKLSQRGLKLKAGQSVSYVITNYYSAGKDRSIPEELVSDKYDSRRYVELLADCCATILYPFGVTKENLLTRSELLVDN